MYVSVQFTEIHLVVVNLVAFIDHLLRICSGEQLVWKQADSVQEEHCKGSRGSEYVCCEIGSQSVAAQSSQY